MSDDEKAARIAAIGRWRDRNGVPHWPTRMIDPARGSVRVASGAGCGVLVRTMTTDGYLAYHEANAEKRP